MMRFAASISILALAVFVAASPARAHHAFGAEYDADKPVQGNVVNWNIELGPPGILTRLGWRHDSLKIGDQVAVEGYSAKDGSKSANAKKVTLADGRSVFAGSQAESKPPK
jgi:hypothetical protein